jgi:hypothetical protein
MPYKNKKDAKACTKRYKLHHPNKIRETNANWAIRKHQITVAEFKLVRKNQNNVCALCGDFLKLGSRGCGNYGCCVDHDHDCDLKEMHFSEKKGCSMCIRGLLCKHCNTFIVHGLEYLHKLGLYTHPYLLKRPILDIRRSF